MTTETAASGRDTVVNFCTERLRRGLQRPNAGHLSGAECQAEVTSRYAAIGVMQIGNGVAFCALAVLACDEVLPLQRRVEQDGGYGDLQDVYDSERHFLYIACTRARHHLHVSGVTLVSESLEDLCAS